MLAWLKSVFRWLTSRGFLRVVLWVLHALLVVGIVLGLWAINRRYHVETELLSPFPWLHQYWLPLLFLLVYAGAWLGWAFFRLLTDPQSGEFPDIDDAWRDGFAALTAAGIDLTEVPLFLVVGKPATSTADFFAATRLPLAVRAEPRRPDAPVKVYATRSAVFVSCEGASVLSRLADRLAARPKAETVLAPLPPAPTEEVDLLDSPLAPAEVVAGELRSAAATAAAPAAHDLMELWPAAPGGDGAVDLPTDEAKRAAARLNYLCRRVADARRPFCPANGILWLVPLAATETEALADRAAAACRADLAAAEAGLQVHCPSAVVVCDAQELPGFRDLLRGLPEPIARDRTLGRSFPLVPGVSPEMRYDVLHSGIGWVARHMLPGVVYQRFGTEAEGNGERWSAANARLWRLTAEVYDRRPALTRLVAQGVVDSSARPPLLVGAYLAGTGPDEQDQAFAAGVVQQLLAVQSCVRWTDAAEAEERDHHRMAAIGYAAAVALLLAVGAFALSIWER